MPGEPLAPGRIYNSNRFTLRGLGEECSAARCTTTASCPTASMRRAALRRAADETDIIVTSGGVSARKPTT